MRANTRESAIANEVIAVLMMLFVIDDIPDILQTRRPLQQHSIAGLEPQRFSHLLKDASGQRGHLSAVFPLTRAGRGESLDCLIP